MRNVFSIGAAIVILGIYSCDKISNPIIAKGGNGGVITGAPTHVDSTTTTDDATLKVLLEEYTGHHCTNCPAGAVQCEALASGPHGNQVILMQVNATSTFGAPGPYAGAPLPDYSVDYRTIAGNNWNTTFINGDANGLPGTMVNRLYFSPGTPGGANDLYANSVDVSTPADSLIGVSPPATINQTVNIHIVDSMYAPPKSALAMGITTKLLAPQAGTHYWLVVALVEDSIFDWQDSLNKDRPYYLKRMTLRTVVNANGSGWGDSLVANTSPQTKYYNFSDTSFKYSSVVRVPPAVPPYSWNMAHMYIVAFVYQRASVHDYLVLQAQRLHL